MEALRFVEAAGQALRGKQPRNSPLPPGMLYLSERDHLPGCFSKGRVDPFRAASGAPLVHGCADPAAVQICFN